MKTKFILTSIIVLCAVFVNAQIRKANKQFERFNYNKAVELYKKCIDKDKEVELSTKRIAECYRELRNMKLSLVWYEKVMKLSQKDVEDVYHYANALKNNGKYNKAKKYYLEYISQNGKKIDLAKNYAKFCDNVLNWNDEIFEFNSELDKKLSSKAADFSPMPYDKGIIVASDREHKDKKSNDFVYTEDERKLKLLYTEISPQTTTELKFKQMFRSSIDDVGHDATPTFAKNGTIVYFSRVAGRGLKTENSKYRTGLPQIYYSEKVKGNWKKPKPFIHNNPKYIYYHPTITEDGNTLYFSSDKPGGFGEKDIYVCFKKNNEWTEPQNLGPVINSIEDEIFPYIYKNSILYFASNGHCGLGGSDIFRSINTNGTWSKPENLRTPINTCFDDFGFVYKKNGQEGYFSSNRPGVGLDDIYKFTVNKIPQLYSLKGKLSYDKSLPVDDIKVFVLNRESGNVKVFDTDEDGNFIIDIKRNTPYAITIAGDKTDPIKFNYFLGKRKKLKSPNLLEVPVIIDGILVAETIYFDLDESNIKDSETRKFIKMLNFLNKHKDITLKLSGHTDSRGTNKYNDNLSQKRIDAVYEYFIKMGLSQKRIINTVALGEKHLVNKCKDNVDCDEISHAKNRRTEIHFIYPERGSNSLSKYNVGETYEKGNFTNAFFIEKEVKSGIVKR